MGPKTKINVDVMQKDTTHGTTGRKKHIVYKKQKGFGIVNKKKEINVDVAQKLREKNKKMKLSA